MPRKRTIADESLLDAALALVRGSGPDSLTFAALAARVGLAPSTLVQRFGTKAALLRTALSQAWDHLDALTAAAIEAAEPGAPGVIEMLVRLSGQYDADTFADQLLVLREDLRDPMLRERGRAWIATMSRAVERCLGSTGRGATGLGELVVAQWQGTLTVWSFTRGESLIDAVRSALEELFELLDVDRRAT